jgi:hypothetical protein
MSRENARPLTQPSRDASALKCQHMRARRTPTRVTRTFSYPTSRDTCVPGRHELVRIEAANSPCTSRRHRDVQTQWANRHPLVKYRKSDLWHPSRRNGLLRSRRTIARVTRILELSKMRATAPVRVNYRSAIRETPAYPTNGATQICSAPGSVGFGYRFPHQRIPRNRAHRRATPTSPHPWPMATNAHARIPMFRPRRLGARQRSTDT